MSRLEILNALKSERGTLKTFGVETLRLFGSTARDQAGPNSDLDFLVTFRHAPTYDRFIDVKLHLEAVLGKQVDLVTENALRPEMRQSVVKDSILVS